MRHTFRFLLHLGILLIAVAEAAAQTYSYDDAGRLVRTVYPNGTGVLYGYDDADNLISTTSTTVPRTPISISATRSAPGQVQLSWQAGSGDATGVVIMRRRQESNNWVEVATVSSGLTFTDSLPDPAGEYVYRIAARGSAGASAYSRDIYPSSSRAVELAVPRGGARRLLSAGSNPVVRAGYARVPIEFGNTPYGTAVFSVTENGVVTSEVGVPNAPPSTKSRIFIDYRTLVPLNIRTGVAIVNPGVSPAKLTFHLRKIDGQTVTVGTGTLDPGAHVARFVDEFNLIASGFVLPADFSTATGYGTLDIESDKPLSTVALRMTINQRGEALFTTTPVADLMASPAIGPLHFPHFADGGGYSTTVVLLNTSSSNQSGTIEFRAMNGSPYTVTTSDDRVGSSFSYFISPGGAFVLQSKGPDSVLGVGSIRVVPAANSSAPFGAGLFQWSIAGVMVSESGIASATPTTRARIYADQAVGYNTGLALANPSTSQNVTLTLRVFQSDGSTPVGAPATVVLSPRGQRPAFVRELISGLPAGFTGVLEVSSADPFAALVVRMLTNSRGEDLLTTFPIADLTRAAASPVIFPQIADGGGYQTELILLSPQGEMTGVVRYFDSSGTPLDAGRIP